MSRGFSMFTTEGDQAVADALVEPLRLLAVKLQPVMKRHPEIGDTEVVDAITADFAAKLQEIVNGA